MHKFVLLFISFVCATFVSAQVVSNVRHERSGESIVVTFDLQEDCYVSLWVSVDGGVSFTAIDDWYTIGEGYVQAGLNRSIRWMVLRQYDTFIHDDVRFKVVANPYSNSSTSSNKSNGTSDDGRSNSQHEKKSRLEYQRPPFILADFAWSSMPQMSGGLMLGHIGYKDWGWYIKGHTSFTKRQNFIASYSNGDILNLESMPAYNKSKTNCEINITAGMTRHLFHVTYFYAGIGFGMRELYWGTPSGWIRQSSYSHTGFSGDLGLMIDISHVLVKCGVNTINFQYVELEVGLGYRFTSVPLKFGTVKNL